MYDAIMTCISTQNAPRMLLIILGGKYGYIYGTNTKIIMKANLLTNVTNKY